MPHQSHTRRNASRLATWAFLVIIPALAIVGLGTGLSLTATGPSTPGGLQTAETREFAALGDSVTGTVKPAAQASLTDFSDTWQNTVAKPPSPRR
jgi:hypothetical protein